MKKKNSQESFEVVQVRVEGGSEYGGRADGELGAFKLPIEVLLKEPKHGLGCRD